MGNKSTIRWRLSFLWYSTGESGMIVRLFSCKPFIKFLFCRYAISFSRFRITVHFPGNFPEISGNLPEISWSPTYPPYPPPILYTHTQYPKPWSHSELQIHFSQKHNISLIVEVFPTTFIWLFEFLIIYEHSVYDCLNFCSYMIKKVRSYMILLTVIYRNK